MEYRTRGIPTTILGNFDDQSSDNSENQVEKDIEEENTGFTAVSKQLNDIDMDMDMALNKNSRDTLNRNEISPPPGDPKIENSARLRRYRHNVE